MSKLKAKYIRFDTTADGTNAQVVPANFTATNYTPVQVASEGSDKISSHLNGINNRLLRNPGDVVPTSFTGTQTASGASVTGLIFANTLRGFTATITVEVVATASLFEQVTIYGIRRSTGWTITRSSVGDESLVEFDIDPSTGQVQYSSGTYPGFTSLKTNFRATALANA